MHHGRLSLEPGILRMPLRIAPLETASENKKRAVLHGFETFRESRPVRLHTGAGGICPSS